MLMHNDPGKRWRVQFDNLSELTRWLASTPRTWDDKSSEQTGGAYGRDWDLGAGYSGALRMASEGWEEGVKNLYALAATVPNITVTTRGFSVAGDFPDVGRAVAGNPFSMVTRRRENAPKPALTIAVNIRTSAAVKAQEMANFGAAMVALVDRLESRGVRVELIGLVATNPVGRNRWAISWTVKRAEDPLDLSAVAFSLAHPAMWRRLGFACMERSPRSMYTPGYGYDGGIHKDDFMDLPEGALLIQGVDHNPGACRTMAGALEFAKRAINKAAGEDIAELEDFDA